MTYEELFERDVQGVQAAWGLTRQMAEGYVIAALYTDYYYGEYPVITSGYRDPRRQAELRRRWDAGLRAGLVARPALVSNHSKGQAIDVQPLSGAAWMYFVHVMRYLGFRWGGSFSRPDPVHFDYE